jgi:hypothetical protein
VPTADDGDREDGVAAIRARMDDERAVSEVVAARLIGLDEDGARRTAEGAARLWRVVRRDEHRFPVSLEYRSARINVEVENGKIVSTSVG